MAFEEKQGLKGRLSITIKDLDDNEIRHFRVNNLITNSGRILLANYLSGKVEGRPQLLIAVGSENIAASEQDDSLKDHIAEVKVHQDDFISFFDISTDLSTYGIGKDEINLFVKKTIAKSDVKITPAPITEQDIAEIYNM